MSYHKLPHLHSTFFREIPGLHHGFFTRQGGYSKGPYESLNCRGGSHDNAEVVLRNLTIVKKCLTASNLQLLRQIHSAKIVSIDKFIGDSPEADAMITSLPGVALGILTADCVPVLFADPVTRIIGAAHAGWKGALGGIVQATVAAMQEKGARPASIIAAIGPAIGKESYEVGADFKQHFVTTDAGAESFFFKTPAGKIHFDLPGYVLLCLERAGVGQIDMLAADTCADPARFFSHRRACLGGDETTGRQISAICLTSA